jgi:hypothetical protein
MATQGFPLSDENDLTVAKSLGRLEVLFEKVVDNQSRLEARLFGSQGDEGKEDGGGLLGLYDRRLKKMEVWFIRVTTIIVVVNFFTGSGPATILNLIKLLGTAKAAP